ncbi:MAG: LysR family transcriptional regulator [Paracoccaceae bacterium]
MDLTLIRTFVEVAACGSLQAASERLLVTQSAVSLRIQRLEDQLGKPLFHRSKLGTELTPSGREFEQYAHSLLRLWEEARQQVALPEGFTESLVIGAQYSLWPRLGFRIIDRLHETQPQLSIRGELGMADRLTRMMIEGSLQMGLFYTPQLRPGLLAEKIMEEELVLVASWPDPRLPLDENYVLVDWGPEFIRAHGVEFPEFRFSGVTLALGAMAADFIRRRRGAGYLPARYVKRYIDDGQLHLVPDAPAFPYPVWLVWRDDMDPALMQAGRAAVQHVVAQLKAELGEVLEELRDINQDHLLHALGAHSDIIE